VGDGAGKVSTAVEISTDAYEGTNCIEFNYTLGGWWAGFGLAFNRWSSTIDIAGCDALSFAYKGPASGHVVSVSLGYSDDTSEKLTGSVTPGGSTWQVAEYRIPATAATTGVVSINFVVGGAQTGTGAFSLDNVQLVSTSGSTSRRVPDAARSMDTGRSIVLQGRAVSIAADPGSSVTICNLKGARLATLRAGQSPVLWQAPTRGMYLVTATRRGLSDMRTVVVR
jgi:hypothetical protein